MTLKARSEQEIKEYWEETWTRLGVRRIHIRDLPAVIELKAGDEERLRADLRVIASALSRMADKPPAAKDPVAAKRFWEATWERLGKQVQFFRDVPAMIELPVGVRGLQLATTFRAMAEALIDAAKVIEEEHAATTAAGDGDAPAAGDGVDDVLEVG